MSQQTITSIFQSLLTLLGSFVIGHAFFGHPITTQAWDIVGGAVLALFGAIWGFVEKTTTLESFESSVLSFVVAIGGLVVSAGWVSADVFKEIIGLLTAIAPAILSYVGRQKVQQQAAGKVVADPKKPGLLMKAGPKISIIILLLGMSMFANAQSPFKAEPKLAPATLSTDLYTHNPNQGHYKKTGNKKLGITTTSTDSILNAWRFGVVVSPVGYTFAGTYQASAGIEYGLQHQDYNYASQKYTVLWSANFVYVPITTSAQITSLQQFETVGALFGVHNNLIQAGPFYNPNTPGAFKQKAGVWIVIGINLN